VGLALVAWRAVRGEGMRPCSHSPCRHRWDAVPCRVLTSSACGPLQAFQMNLAPPFLEIRLKWALSPGKGQSPARHVPVKPHQPLPSALARVPCRPTRLQTSRCPQRQAVGCVPCLQKHPHSQLHRSTLTPMTHQHPAPPVVFPNGRRQQPHATGNPRGRQLLVRHPRRFSRRRDASAEWPPKQLRLPVIARRASVRATPGCVPGSVRQPHVTSIRSVHLCHAHVLARSANGCVCMARTNGRGVMARLPSCPP
jgi:hypothetical protein